MANRAFIRLPAIAWTGGDTFQQFIVRLTAAETDATTGVKLKLGFVDADDQAAPADAVALEALVMTTETVEWEPGAWTAGEEYDTPDLKTSAQEVADRAGWGTGQAMVLILEDNGSDANAFRKFVTQDAGANGPVAYYG